MLWVIPVWRDEKSLVKIDIEPGPVATDSPTRRCSGSGAWVARCRATRLFRDFHQALRSRRSAKQSGYGRLRQPADDDLLLTGHVSAIWKLATKGFYVGADVVDVR